MNKKTKSSPKVERGECLCYGTGPALTELLRRLGPPEEVRRHFSAARVEFLKGLRALIDARIEQVSKATAKGEKIEVE
jgi:hypothetical protein